jgi:hypothetical protein
LTPTTTNQELSLATLICLSRSLATRSTLRGSYPFSFLLFLDSFLFSLLTVSYLLTSLPLSIFIS